MLSVNPKGSTAGDPSDSHPKSRTYHPYSDKMIDASARRDRQKFDTRKELARNDRELKKLSDAKRRGRVLYAS